MKNYFLFPVLIMAFTGLISCSDNPTDDNNGPDIPDPTETILKADPTELSFFYNQVTAKEITVTTNAADGFEFEILRGDWFTVQETDKGISIAPKDANQDEEKERIGFIELTATDADPVTIQVSQDKYGLSTGEEYLRIDPKTITFLYGESVQPQPVGVDTNIDGGYTIVNDTDWVITANEQADSFTVSVKGEWDKYSDRTAAIYIKAGDFSETLTVTQKGSGQVVFSFEQIGDVDIAALDYEGVTEGTLKFTEDESTNYDGEYIFTVRGFSGYDDEFRASIAYGDASKGENPDKRYITIAVDENPVQTTRFASITITATEDTNVSQTIDFVQQARPEDYGSQFEGTWWVDFEPLDDYFMTWGEDRMGFAQRGEMVYDKENKQLLVEDLFLVGRMVSATLVFDVVDENIYLAHDVVLGNEEESIVQKVGYLGINSGNDYTNLTGNAGWVSPFVPDFTGDTYLRPMNFQYNGEECSVVLLAYDGNDLMAAYSIYLTKEE